MNKNCFLEKWLGVHGRFLNNSSGLKITGCRRIIFRRTRLSARRAELHLQISAWLFLAIWLPATSAISQQRRLWIALAETFKTMEELPRYHGHFYNWYDTRTLHPFHPRYISTADSGNLSGSLITLGAGFAELVYHPILPEGWRKGLEDTAQILLDELHMALKNPPQGMDANSIRRIQKTVTEQIKSLGSAADTLSGTYRALTLFASTLSEVESLVSTGSEPDFWFRALRNQCEDLRNDLIYLAPWLDLEQRCPQNSTGAALCR